MRPQSSGTFDQFFTFLEKGITAPVSVAIILALGQVILCIVSLWFLRPQDNPTEHVKSVMGLMIENPVPYWLAAGAFVLRLCLDGYIAMKGVAK